MTKNSKILYCSSGKTYGHFLKTHALFLNTKDIYRCVEAVNPTEFVLPFRSNEQVIEKELYFTNNSFETYEKLENNINHLVDFVHKYSPDLVIGDKLPNLMTACFQSKIPYFSISHATQLSHNWQNEDNYNLGLFDQYWENHSLEKPVSDHSWFFYRNWGNLIIFADEKVNESENLDKLGYKYEFIGHLPVNLGDTQNHLKKINDLISENSARAVVLFTLSSYADKESDDLLIKLALVFPNIVFVYPRSETGYLEEKSTKLHISNIYSPHFIDYDVIKPALSLVICLPGNATLNSLLDFKREILALYRHPEQANNAMHYIHPNFSFYKFSDMSFEVCALSIERCVNHSSLPQQNAGISQTESSIIKFKDILANFTS